MKRTENINLGGVLFIIDEDAYLQLSDYIRRLETWFATKHGGNDVAKDIEARLAEIFLEYTKGGQQIVSHEMVAGAIATMGEPEEMDSAEDGEVGQPSATEDAIPIKRLFRDGLNKVLGGVCGGLAAYFNIDVTIVRVLFVVLPFMSFGAIIPIYIILWIAVPEAVTPIQRLMMTGQPINLSNVEKMASDGFNTIRSDVNEIKSKWKSKGRNKANGWLIVALGVGLAFLARRFFSHFGDAHFVGWYPNGVSFFGLLLPSLAGIGLVIAGIMTEGRARLFLLIVGGVVMLYMLMRWILFFFHYYDASFHFLS